MMSTLGHNMGAFGQFSNELFGNLFHHVNLKRRPGIDYYVTVAGTSNASLPLTGKIVIVTGSNRGIGKEIVRDCANLGAQKIIMAVRDVKKGHEARNEIANSICLSVEIVVKKLDLDNFSSVHEFANDIVENEERIDFLINNAGMLGGQVREEVDGMDRMMRVNFFSTVLLSLLLLPKLKETSEQAKIVFVASQAHWTYPHLDVDDLELKNKAYNHFGMYGHSKLALVMFARVLASKAYVHGIQVYAVDPGVAPTDIARDSSTLHKWFVYSRITKPFLRTSKEAADSVMKSVVANDKSWYNPTTFYFCDGIPKKPSRCVFEDEHDAQKLWSVVRTTLNLPIMDTL